MLFLVLMQFVLLAPSTSDIPPTHPVKSSLKLALSEHMIGVISEGRSTQLEWPLRLWRFVSSLTSKLPYRCVPGLFTDCNVKNGLRRDGEGFLLLLEALAIGPRTA